MLTMSFEVKIILTTFWKPNHCSLHIIGSVESTCKSLKILVTKMFSTINDFYKISL